MGIKSELFLTFGKIGLFTFGGGYAMISLIEDICVERKKWISHEEMMNLAVLAESTPGPIAINCASYVGYKRGGFTGAMVATIGMVLPSFCIIYLISLFLDEFLEIRWVFAAFQGIKLAVGIVICDAALRMLKRLPKKPLPLGIMCFAFLLMLRANLFAYRLSSISLMLAAAVVSLSLYFMKNRRERGREEESREENTEKNVENSMEKM